VFHTHDDVFTYNLARYFQRIEKIGRKCIIYVILLMMIYFLQIIAFIYITFSQRKSWCYWFN